VPESKPIFDVEKLSTDDLLHYGSKRHHYIPEFFTKGFCNEDGRVYCYDKQEDVIIKQPKAPRAIFYGHDRNTIDFGEHGKSSFLEDYAYSKTDNYFSKQVRYFRNTAVDEIKFDVLNTTELLIFAVCLYWRSPANDDKIEQIINDIDFHELPPNLRALADSPIFPKIKRFGLLPFTLEQIAKFGHKKTIMAQVRSFSNPLVLLGDNPSIFRAEPSRFADLGDQDFIFPISSSRVFISSEESISFIKESLLTYNVQTIRQAHKYVVAADLDVLKVVVGLYRDFKERGQDAWFQERVFQTKDP